MSEERDGQSLIDDQEVEFDDKTLRRVRERVLSAEKDKLNLDIPQGINNEIEEIIREEIR